jgi:hypothetical protein
MGVSASWRNPMPAPSEAVGCIKSRPHALTGRRMPLQCASLTMPNPIDAVHDIIARNQQAHRESNELLLYVAETLVEMQYVLKSGEYDAEKLAAIEGLLRDMIRRISGSGAPPAAGQGG